MPTNFPSSADSFTNPSPSDSMATVSHADQHTDVNDAVEAIETALLDGAPLHIDDANERVGIGTTTPTYDLHVAGGNKALVDGVFSTTSVAEHARLYLNDVNFGIGAGRFGAGTDDDLYLWAYNGAGRGIRFMRTVAGDSAVDGGAWVTSMEINNSGHVLMPNQPAFAVYHGGSADVTYTGVIDFNTKDFDVGNNFNLSTDTFTAPVSGVYQFNWTSYTNVTATASGYRTSIYVNGVQTIMNGRWAAAHNTLSALIQLSAGDAVTLRAVAGFTVGFYGAVGHNLFSGYLVA